MRISKITFFAIICVISASAFASEIAATNQKGSLAPIRLQEKLFNILNKNDPNAAGSFLQRLHNRSTSSAVYKGDDINIKNETTSDSDGDDIFASGLIISPSSLSVESFISDVIASSERKLQYVRPMALGLHLFKFEPQVTISEAKAIQKILSSIPSIGSVEIDSKAQSLIVPNDPFIQYQHALMPSSSLRGNINAVQAWDITRGATNSVVAIIDTGIAASAEFAGRLLPGYDFISNSFIANDGDGRDPDASDPGDWVITSDGCAGSPRSTWHGTHVAGIIGANGNNGVGIAGVDWNTKIVPVRVLGKCGGQESDIIEAMLWAAGVPVPGVPNNPHPAKIINMSLRVPTSAGCTWMLQNAIQQVKAQGAIVVVAAGNSNSEVTRDFPASCAGVITVGAVDPYGEKASYSNYSTSYKVHISAPGGDARRYGQNAGILSTVDAGSTIPIGPSGDFKSGTSMAAPHVSGTLSLALSINPNLSFAELAALLLFTSEDFPPTSLCKQYYPLCGEGILNAYGMVAGAAALRPFTVVTEFYNIDNKHYFRTGTSSELNFVESGAVGRWVNTEDYFVAWRDASSGALPVCRFYAPGPRSHFYTLKPSECEAVKGYPGWVYEGVAFYAHPAQNSICPDGLLPLHRFYNNRFIYNDSNHRFTVYGEYHWPTLQAQGWIYEGVAMCVAG